MPNFYEALKQERIKRHLTQEEMANLLSIKRSTYSLYESGKRMPKTDTLDKIAEALDVLIYYDHEAHQYQFITFEDGQTIHTIRTYDSAQENTEKFQKKIESEQKKADYDNSYSYASSEEEFDKRLEQHQNRDNEHFQQQHTLVIDTKIDETNPINIILKKQANGEELTPEESKLLNEHIKKSIKSLAEAAGKLKISLEETFSKYYAQLNEAGQKEADKQIEKAIERATQQAKEQAEAQIILLTKIPEYQKKPEELPPI